MTRNQGWALAMVLGLAAGTLGAVGCSSKAAARAEKTTNAPLAGVVPHRALALKPVAKPAAKHRAHKRAS